jgi:Flp pilus assembly protein TadD
VSDTLSTTSEQFDKPNLCPSCGTSIKSENICPNCGTDLRAAAAQDSNELKPVDQLLLERLEKDPPIEPKSVSMGVIAGVLVLIVAIAFGMWSITKKTEVFAEGRTEGAHGEHHPGDGHDHGMSAADSAAMQEQMAILNGRIDSLEHIVQDNPSDDSARINLATALSIKGDFERAKGVYEEHLKRNPKDANARVDYASVVIETTNDPKSGMVELERAIQLDPKNAKALFNAAILSLQMREDHMASFKKSRDYLRRAKEASIKDNPAFATQIDMLIAEMDKKEAEIKASKDSTGNAGVMH